MRVIITDHEVTVSTPSRIELDARSVTLFTREGESYVLSQNTDGTLRIEAPGGDLSLDVVSAAPRVGRITAQGSCQACAARLARGLEGPCREHETPGPRILKGPKRRTVLCSACGSTIEYAPWDMFCAPSMPGSDDVGPMAVKCPEPRCGGRGYP